MAILARINHQIEDCLSDLKKLFGKDVGVAISKYLDERLVLFLQSHTRDEVLEELVDLASREGKIKDGPAFRSAIFEREKLVSTGIGLGVAIPHAKLQGYTDFFIAIGIQPEGVEWNAQDAVPVKLVFMIGGPDNQQTKYLKILSHLTLAIKSEERRKRLFKAKYAKDVIELFNEC